MEISFDMKNPAKNCNKLYWEINAFFARSHTHTHDNSNISFLLLVSGDKKRIKIGNIARKRRMKTFLEFEKSCNNIFIRLMFWVRWQGGERGGWAYRL